MEIKTRGNCAVSDLIVAVAPIRLVLIVRDFAATKAVIISLTFRLQWVSIHSSRVCCTYKAELYTASSESRCVAVRLFESLWSHAGTMDGVLTCTHGWCTSTRLRTYTYVGGAPFYTRRAYITRNISSTHSCSIPLRGPASRLADTRRDRAIVSICVRRYSGTRKSS